MLKKVTKLGFGICAFVLASTLLVKGNVRADITEGEQLKVGENVTAVLDNTGVLTISGTGDMWEDVDDTAEYYNKWFNNQKSRIYKIVIKKGVTSIGRRAFHQLENVQSVSIPDTVTIIEPHAFRMTKALRDVKIPNSVTKIGVQAFYESGIEKCTIGKNVREIDNFAFAHCEKLYSISIPSGVESVGQGAFSESGVSKVSIGDKVGVIRKDAFPAVKATIHSKKVIIDENAFAEGSVLKAYKGSSADEYAKLNDLYIRYIKDKSKEIIKPKKVTGLKLVSLYKGFGIKFPKVKNAAGYEISYASNSAMLEPGKIFTGKNKFTLKGLERGKKYYIKVRAYRKVKGKRVFGKYSKVVKGKTK
nr:fibronectin type III domain-containing protein [uncultured Catonella sp.]